MGLNEDSIWVVDTETTGLRPYHGDKPFAVVVNGEYIDDFSQLPDFSKPRTYIFHNAKFDMSMLANIGIELHPKAEVYCTMTMDRIACDNRGYGKGGFSLGQMSARYGSYKDDTVEKYIAEHELYKDVEIPGKSKPVRLMFYDKVPEDIMKFYALRDVVATRCVYHSQRAIFLEQAQQCRGGQVSKAFLINNEKKLLRVVWDMERHGALIDKGYVRNAIDHYTRLQVDCLEEFKELTSLDFAPKPTLYKKVFAAEKWQYTKKGNPSFSGDVLDTFVGPAAVIVNKLRDCKHQLDTYYGLIYHADADDVVHTNFNQHIARTGRFSSSGPNLQNMEKPKGEAPKFTPRRAIVPRPGFTFFKPDYNQMEYRMMLDHAGAHDLIAQVNGGLDVHTAMAEKLGIPRHTMKNGNFAILYGSGDEALAQTIKGSLAQAKELRRSIERGAPEIARWVQHAYSRIRRDKFVTNWCGRIFRLKPGEVYKAPNCIIQGGCADVMKVAMVRIAEYLKETDSPIKMVLNVHDELVFEVPTHTGAQEDPIVRIIEIMESVYEPLNGLGLTVSADWSSESLA